MPVVMCFGDSNTHGTPPIVDLARYDRYGVGVRWPSRVQAALGCAVIEEGLPGRTAQFEDPIMGAHMNGQVGLKIALESHGPLDVLVLMLGTNDVKAMFNQPAADVANGVALLLKMLKTFIVGAIAKETNDNCARFQPLGGQRRSDRNRDAAADNTVGAQIALAEIGDVHRAAAALQ